MKIGIPKEIKKLEKRVAVTPAGVTQFIKNGHAVYVEKNAGSGSNIPDAEFEKAGAIIISGADDIWREADMIFKVKEPVAEEFQRMKTGQVIFTYLHLAAEKELALMMMEKEAVGIAYETVRKTDGSLPLLAPMSEVAGRLSVQMGCACLEAKNQGRGILLSGVPGVRPAEVVILGGGISGLSSAHLAVGMGARVTLLDINVQRLRAIEDLFHSRIVTLMSNPSNIESCLGQADRVIGSVLIPGAKAPKLITRDMVRSMKKGSAIVDVAIDQGGCAETSRPTTHDAPMYVEEGVVHYCVTNMPGSVPLTSTYALTNVTLPYALALADKGWKKALADDPALAGGLNVSDGKIRNPYVAEALGIDAFIYH
jgi:alanine dehydrogenase